MVLVTPSGTRDTCATRPSGQACPAHCTATPIPLRPSTWALGVSLVAGAVVLALLASLLRARQPVRRAPPVWP
jgi:hypothetical protein